MNLPEATKELRVSRRRTARATINIRRQVEPVVSYRESRRELTRRIAEREKRNLLRAAAREPGRFGEWLDEFYRDFMPYIIRESLPALGDGAAAYATGYINRSRELLAKARPEDMELVLKDWAEQRAG